MTKKEERLETITDDEIRKSDFDLTLIPGLGPTSIKKLQDDGVNNILALINRSPIEVKNITGVDIEIVRAFFSRARDILRRSNVIGNSFRKSSEVKTSLADLEYVSTGCSNLDRMFQGKRDEKCAGIPTKAITEVFGEFGCGKTQLAIKLAIMAQLPKSEGGLDGRVIYMDCENVYDDCVDRIDEIASLMGKDLDEIHDNIIVNTPKSSDEMIQSLPEVERLIQKEGVRMIIIDGFMSNSRLEEKEGGSEMLPVRSRFVGRYLGRLDRIANAYNVAIYITTQVTTNPRAGQFADPISAYGGKLLEHGSTYRVYFKKTSIKKSKVWARIVDSPRHTKDEVEFYLTPTGPGDKEYVK